VEKLEATLRGQIKELNKVSTDVEATKKRQKKLQESEVHKKQGKTALRGQIEEPEYKFIEDDSDKENWKHTFI
jgi:hypothetical protein